MANSVKLLNYVEAEGEYLRFFTELDANFEVGDKVFIVGGNYDNVGYTDKANSLYDPYHKFAMGYRVVSVDNTSNSNALTLNIEYSDTAYTSGGVTTLIFNPLPVYKTTDDLLLEPNQIRESYISRTYFKRGEFNGGTFDGGIFGEYNIQGTASTKKYQRQHFVDQLVAKYRAAGKTAEANALRDKDFSVYESPVEANSAVFNNNFNNPAAKFTNGVFVGGDWNWGEWTSKYTEQNTGKKQSLTETGLVTTTFRDNNGGKGYNYMLSGNVGRVYSNKPHNLTIQGTSVIFNDFIPFPITQAYARGFKVQIKIYSPLNERVFDIALLDNVNKSVTIETSTIHAGVAITHQLYNESGVFKVDAYIADSDSVPNRFTTGQFLSLDWFAGKVYKGSVLGGDWFSGEFLSGNIASEYQRLNWYGGHFSGKSVAENVLWKNGNWYDGQWRGDSIVSALNFQVNEGQLLFSISLTYAHLFEVGKDVFISYIKKSLNNSYLDNYTDLPNNKLINYQTFELTDIILNEDLNQATLVLNGDMDAVTNVNLVNAKVSQSAFEKGVWYNGVWESGLRRVETTRFATNSISLVGQNLQLDVENTFNFTLGEKCLVTNIGIQFSISGADVTLPAYTKPLHDVVTIVDINRTSNTITVSLPSALLSLDSDAGITSTVTGATLIEHDNAYNVLTNNVWVNGDFRAGVWRGGVWKNGLFRNKLYFDLNNEQAQSIWQSGYWMNGEFNGGAFLSGVWEGGTWKNGIMTNMFNNQSSSLSGWNPGDSIWINGQFDDGVWKGGLFKNGIMRNGTIQNGGIEKLNWKAGIYDNGLGLYDNTLYANRSGKFIPEQSNYDSHSAPSLISIDGNGWVQLDQPSFYQKGYNVIFQDLVGFVNPFNNQMFTVRDRDAYATRFKIDYASTEVDNPLYEVDTYKFQNPIIVGDYLTDACEVIRDNGQVFWLLDKGHQRIISINKTTKEVDVLGVVINNPRKSIYTFLNLSRITTTAESAFVYVVDGVTIKKIAKYATNNPSLPEREIYELNPIMDRDETIMDIWLSSTGSDETVFIFTSKYNVYYNNSTSLIFRKLSLNLGNVQDATITYAKADGSNTVHAIVRVKTTIESLKHYVLDYSLSDNTYSVRNNSISSINETSLLSGSNIVSLVTAFEGAYLKIWIATTTDMYVLSYRNFFNGNSNQLVQLNDQNALDCPVHRLKMGWNNEYLLVIGKDSNNIPVFLSTASLNRYTTGFSNKNSTVKTLNTYQDVALTDNRQYYYYDSSVTSTVKRIISVDPLQIGGYNPNTNVDTIGGEDEVIKIINGGNASEAFSILRRGSSYMIRRSLFNSENEEISTTYQITDSDTYVLTEIHDIAFSRNTLFLAYSARIGITNAVRIGALTNFASSSDMVQIPVTDLRYALSDLGVAAGSGEVLFDVIENRDIFLGMLFKSGFGFYQLNIDNTQVTSKQVYANAPKFGQVRDLALTASNSLFNLFISFDNEVVKTIADSSYVEASSTFYRWTQLDENTDNDSVFSGKSISEVYRTPDSKQMVIKNGGQFVSINSNYDTDKFDTLVTDIIPVSSTSAYALSNQQLVLLKDVTNNATYSKVSDILVGTYKQRNSATFSDVFDASVSLNNPFALTLASGFNGAENYLFFIDNTNDFDSLLNDTKKFVRYYNITTGVYDIAKPLESLGNNDSILRDLFYHAPSKSVYGIRDQYSFGAPITTMFKFVWGGGEIYDVEDVAHFTKSYTKFTLFTSGNDRIGAVLLNSNGIDMDLVVDITEDAITDHIVTIVRSRNMKDVSAIVRNTTLEVYYRVNNLVYVTNNNLTDVDLLDELQWNPGQAIGEFDNVKYLSELSNGTGVLINDSNRTITHLSATPTPTSAFTLTDVSLISSTNTRNAFFYSSMPKGVLKQSYSVDNKVIDLRMSGLLTSSTTGAYIKMIAVSGTIAYALFDNGLFKYNFVSQKVSPVTLDTVKVEYRDENEQYPADITNFKYKLVDIEAYEFVENGVVQTELMVVAEILQGSSTTGAYDILVYNGSSFSRDRVVNLYAGMDSRDAITQSGSIASRLNANPLSSTGGIFHLFKSTVKPNLSTVSGSVFIEFTTNAIRKVVKITDYIPVQYYDNVNVASVPVYAYRVAMKAVDFAKTEIVTAALLQDGKIVAYSTNFAMTVFTVSGVNVLNGQPNQLVVSFPKTSVVVNNDSLYTIQLFANRTGSLGDFKVIADDENYELVYKNGLSIATDNIHDVYYTLSIVNNAYTLASNGVGSEQIVYNLGTPTSANKISQKTVSTFVKQNHESTVNRFVLSEYNNKYSFTTINQFYRIQDNTTRQVLSPYVTSRVLFNTQISDGVQFNLGGTLSTAHTVAATWKNKLFIGSWDAPYYLNNNVIDRSSMFLSGTFEGTFYDGYFLGGTFRNGGQPSSVVQGHFASDNAAINFESGIVRSDYRYDITSAKYERSLINNVAKDYLWFDVTCMLLNNSGDYVQSPTDQLGKGRVVVIPTIFKQDNIIINSIIKPKYDFYNTNAVILKIVKKNGININMFGGSVFLRATEYVEFLFGKKTIIDKYEDIGAIYVVIESSFAAFNTAGEYVPIVKPQILTSYKTIAHSVATKTGVRVAVEISVPEIGEEAKLRYIQSNYLNDHVQMMYRGKYSGEINLPDYMQMFTLTFAKTNHDMNVQFTSPAKNLYLSDIISSDGKSKVVVNLGANAPATCFAKGVTVSNSYITTPTNRNNDWIDSSFFFSGTVDRDWKSGGWLNLDSRGFSNANSSFTGVFDGAYTNIVDLFFEGKEFAWIELSSSLNIKVNEFIYLRGFTGSKSMLIGAERSKAFKILEVDGVFVKIKNPFKLYYGITSPNNHFTDFNRDYLQVRKQSMLLKKSNISVNINSEDEQHTFNYGVASVSCWNGGNFTGSFKSVWNAGNFRDGSFAGKWFGSNESVSWQGNTMLTTVASINGFAIRINLTNATVSLNDVVYVRLHDIVKDGQVKTVANGFYATVQQDSEGLFVERQATNAIKNASYAVTVTRYRIGTVTNSYLITDYNTNALPATTLQDHSVMNFETSISNAALIENQALLFTGANAVGIPNHLSHVQDSDNSFSMDMWFNYDDLTDSNKVNPLISFQDENQRGTLFYVRNNNLILEYQSLNSDISTEEILFNGIISSRWFHLSFFYTPSGVKALLYDQDYSTSFFFNKNLDMSFNTYTQSFIGKKFSKNDITNSISETFFNGRIDEIRFWSTDMFSYFDDTISSRENTLFDKRVVNKYIPELLAYYNAENALDTASIYPENEMPFLAADATDMPISLRPTYAQTDADGRLSFVSLGSVNVATTAATSEQYNPVYNSDQVSRSSTFLNGEFTSDTWYNGIFIGGNVTSANLIWKYGIKHGGTIKSVNTYKRIGATSFTSANGAVSVYDPSSTTKSVLMSTTIGAFASGVRMDLVAGSYRITFRMKSNFVGDSTSLLATINILAGSSTISSTTVRADAFALRNTYTDIIINFGLAVDTRSVELSMEQTNAACIISLDYVDVVNQLQATTVTGPAKLHWLGGFHFGNDGSSIENLIWYRGLWMGGTWVSGNWFALTATNSYDKAYSVWKKGVWRSDSIIQHANKNLYAPTATASIWHGGTWESDVMPGQTHTYTNTNFKSYAVKNNNVLQLPNVNSTWLGGQWLRGEWNGGLFVNGLWHSASQDAMSVVKNYEFTNQNITSAPKITAVVSGVNNLLAVGANGTAYRYASNSWSPIITSVSTDLFAGVTNGDKTFLVGAAGVILATNPQGVLDSISWTNVQSERKSLYDIAFINNNIGYICGDGVILKTTDGGITWIKTLINAVLRSIHHNGTSQMISVGDGGKIFVSLNGTSWTQVLVPSLTSDIIKVCFVNETTAFAISKNGKLIKTTTAGASWTQLPVTNINSNVVGFHMVSLYVGYVLTYANNQTKLHTTYDAGESWSSVIISSQIAPNSFKVIAEKLYLTGDTGTVLVGSTYTHSLYEESIGYKYNENSSVWNGGMMLNSIWEGGVVEYTTDILETVFGDILTQFKSVDNTVTNFDFKWGDSNHMKLKKSDVFSSIVYKRLLGRDYFTGYHNGIGSERDIEVSRVINQYNEDGIMSVYWKRGKWNNGLFQFSHWNNCDLNNKEIDVISVDNNTSFFDAGYFYSSYWKGGLWNNKPSSAYPFVENAVPKSLFYQSQWESGYWQSGSSSNGLISDDENDQSYITDGRFSKSMWSSGVWEGGLFIQSLWRSGVNKSKSLVYKGTSINLVASDNNLDATMAVALETIVYPNFDTIGRLGSQNTLLNQGVAIEEQPVVSNSKKYVLNKNNTISVVDANTNKPILKDGLPLVIKLDFQELYGEIFNTSTGSNQGTNLPSNRVTALSQIGNLLWVGTDSGLWKIDAVLKTSQLVKASINVTSIYLSASTIAVGTTTGLLIINPITNAQSVFTGGGTGGYTGASLPSNSITAVHGSVETVYAGTLSGLWILNLKTMSATVITTATPNNGNVLPSNTINALLRSGSRLWVGTNAGLWMLNLDAGVPVGQLFNTENTFAFSTGQQMPSNVVTALTQSSSGTTIWVGTNAGLWRIDKQ